MSSIRISADNIIPNVISVVYNFLFDPLPIDELTDKRVISFLYYLSMVR